jgi:A/G-specific adenine glycosylase
LKKKAIITRDIIPFQGKLLSWFIIFGRHHFPWRNDKLTSYQVVIAEILLQRTKAETIEKFYDKFLDIFPNWESIAMADTSFIEEKLQPIGLYRQRAKRIKDLAIEMVKREGQLPSERHILETIPFLGQYIANAIELQVFNKPSPLLDVNMARVLERHFGERQMVDIRYDPYLQDLANRVTDHPQSKALNWAILDFAATVCKARKPLCEKCLLSSSCKFKLKL